MPMLSVDDLRIGRRTPSGWVEIVRGVDLRIDAGECLGLVGPSGAGKTLTAQALAGLVPAPLEVRSGRVTMAGATFEAADRSAWQGRRGREVLLLFQSPLAALDPVATVGSQIADAVVAARHLPRRAAWDSAVAALSRVDLDADRARQYPWELSGGMRQRVLLAMAWALEPRVVLADEPATGLDPVRQHEILHLLVTLTRTMGSALLLVSHDLRLVAHAAGRTSVLSDGRIVETGETARVFEAPTHPVTCELVRALNALGDGDAA